MLLWEGSSWQSVYNMGRVSGSGWVSIQLPRGSCLLVDLKDGPKRLFEYPEAIISAILFIIIVIIIHSDLKTIENCFLKIVCFCVWFAAFFTTPRIICIRPRNPHLKICCSRVLPQKQRFELKTFAPREYMLKDLRHIFMIISSKIADLQSS